MRRLKEKEQIDEIIKEDSEVFHTSHTLCRTITSPCAQKRRYTLL